MTFFGFIYNIIIAPIELIIEWVFCFYKSKIAVGGIAGAILAVSLAVNFLALPLYNIADRLQEKERNLQLKLQKQLARIKHTFKGDEKFMMIQALYAENHYHPIYSLRSSLSILIEIPFFIAAYQFLSHSSSLQGASFAFLGDLGTPDGLLKISFNGIAYSFNILPVVMTFINFISGAIYLKKAPLKEKIQLYGLALLFLYILYNSPSGLVCYWILNNLFSLFKNLVNSKVKNPAKLVHKVISAILLIASCVILLNPRYNIVKRLSVLLLAFAVLLSPICFSFIKKRKFCFVKTNFPEKDSLFHCFILSTIGLVLLTGLLIPSGIINTSPIEFSFIGNTQSPLVYIFSSLSFFIGLFFFWPLVIYKLFDSKVKETVSYIYIAVFFLALLNVFVFKYNYGNFSIFFQLEDTKCLKKYTPFFTVLPIFVFSVIFVLIGISKRFKAQKYIFYSLFILCIAEFAMGIKNTMAIKREYEKYAKTRTEREQLATNKDNTITPIYHLSKDKKNVVVIFLDKAVSSFFPYIVKEFPEMEDQFSGFVYYPNTVSFAGNTAKAAPALMGGYEYTPENENLRADELLKDKHNEASLFLPKLFLDAGFDVTVTDPPMPNYSWQGDFSFFQRFPEIHVSEVHSNYKEKYLAQHPELKNLQLDKCVKFNLQSFTILEFLPPLLRFTFYYFGEYYRDEIPKILSSVTNDGFLSNYAHLFFLDELTDSENKKESYIFIESDATHEFALLENKTYKPALNINENLATGGYYDFKYLPSSEESSDLAAYHSNAATMLQVAKWLNKLKELSVYDNTRIIIVADHGAPLSLPPFRNMEYGEDIARYNPLFMFKDFYAKGKIKTDDSFMTNADTIFLATKNLPVSENNPFTNQKYSDYIKKDIVNIHHIVRLSDFDEINPNYLRDKKTWVLQDEKNHTPSYTVHDNIFDESNWTRIIK
ncbi:membrane protein insertase YidC [Treponema ruminis]|uniref:YidC/Oxa1 family membrane protein insertase n=1 Tax=Treponema ruminis TaxID=744515 RepID=A0A7W8LLE2_9SPIR|nr:membrane protein insertase YidC [Treponema ruminis]MBB5225258.1 YidC/Oxa1 family membrane protein insertase [Treponema ruminis]QSI01871.1 membrane protein insertase YidC [Treponema ruminis]